MIACLYINGRPVAVDVELPEGTAEFIAQSEMDHGEIVAQVALFNLDASAAHTGHCRLAKRGFVRKYIPDETLPESPQRGEVEPERT